MSALAAAFGVLYMLVPLVAMSVAIWRASRLRATSPLRPLLGTFMSAAIIGFAINFIYAQAAAARWQWSQVLLTSWFVAAVLIVLKAFDAGVVKMFTKALPQRRKVAMAMRVVVLFLVGMPYVMAIGMVYRPKVRGSDPREQLGIGFQDVTFANGKLSGWWIEPASGAGPDTVLICHGLGASKSNFLPMAEPMLRAGYNVFIFDFRAHGTSAGQVTTFGDAERRDVLAAASWLKRERPANSRHIMGLGASMGAAALIAASADDSPEGRAIDAIAVYGTYDDLGVLTKSICNQHFPPPLNWLARYVAVPLAVSHSGTRFERFAPADLPNKVPPRAILIIHGNADEIIPIVHGHALFARAKEPKQSLWLDGTHNSVLNDSTAARATVEFFKAGR